MLVTDDANSRSSAAPIPTSQSVTGGSRFLPAAPMKTAAADDSPIIMLATITAAIITQHQCLSARNRAASAALSGKCVRRYAVDWCHAIVPWVVTIDAPMVPRTDRSTSTGL